MDSSIITSRVREDVKRKLEEECKSKNLTLNTLVSQILSKHTDWGRFANEAGFVYMTKEDAKAFLELIPIKKIEEIVHTKCKTTMRNAIDFIQGEFTFDSFIQTLDLWIGSSNIEFRHISTNKSEKYIVHHKLGKKWSTYFLALVETLSWDLDYGVVKKILDDNSLSFEIKKIK